MAALKIKYEQNKAEVLKCLNVSQHLLTVMTQQGLVDDSDCVKYQAIDDVKKRNSSLMKTLVERRTERAYPLFIHCLRQVGQDAVANLLTDIGEETRILTHLQSELQHEVDVIGYFIRQEERRAGIAPAEGEEGLISQQEPPPPAATSDKEVWTGVQSTLKKAGVQLQRCRAVIEKLHQDCQSLAQANGDMVIHIRSCYNRVKNMLRPGESSHLPGEVPKSTQAMFQSLIEDVEKLMNRRSRAQQEENDGRTTAMRLLRHLRDWIQERSSILDTLHSSTSCSSPPVNRLPLLSSRRDIVVSSGRLRTRTPLLPGQHTPSPPRSQVASDLGSPLTCSGDSGGQDRGIVELAEHVRHVEPRAISTVLEGLQLLEQQVRQYVHMEILLTDKFRAELRYRHLHKKSQGYSPHGLQEARRALDSLESADSVYSGNPASANTTLPAQRREDKRAHLTKLRASLDAMCQEYNACATYMNRACSSLTKIQDMDGLLTHTEDLTHQKNKKNDKDKKNRHAAEVKTKEKPVPAKGFFCFKKSDSAKPASQNQEPNLPSIETSEAPNHRGKIPSDAGSLLAQLKLLVANYEMVKLRQNRLEDRYRRELDHKKRGFESALREKDEEITKLQIRQRELEAEKEKYRSLYDKMKVTFCKKR